MRDFYDAFYAAVEHSPAHHAFCERVYGMDLAQHGFADREQLNLLLEVTRLGPADRALDLGCGNGKIAEWLSDRCGAHITGMDYIPAAIRRADERTASRRDRLSFLVGDINRLDLPPAAFDWILSIDSIYFSEDYAATIRTLRLALKPGGGMAFLYAHGREPWVPVGEFRKDSIQAEKTPLADALRANGLAFRTWYLTKQDYKLALRRRQVLLELKPQFETEGALFIFENRMGDTDGIRQAIEVGLHGRYLYIVNAG